MRALLVEKSRQAYRELQAVPARYPDIEVRTFHGEFVRLVPELLSQIPESAFSFLFIDPKGWRIDMAGVAPLIKRQHCEVLFNFMFEFINRAASMKEEATVQGLDQLITVRGWRDRLSSASENGARISANMRKEVLVEAFSETLRAMGNYTFVAETPIFRPDKDRTLYSLIYSTRKSPGIVEFRRVQIEALRKQETIRAGVKMKKVSGAQDELFAHAEMGRTDVEIYLSEEKKKADALFLSLVPVAPSSITYAEIWPIVMSRHAVTKPTLNNLTAAHRKSGRLILPDWGPRQRVPSETGRIFQPC